jgi:hypothetical protein
MEIVLACIIGVTVGIVLVMALVLRAFMRGWH